MDRRLRILFLGIFMSCMVVILLNNIQGQSYGYNKIQKGVTINSGNVTYITGGNFTQAEADLLYASIIWGYNQTSASGIYNYNHTTISNAYTNAMILANTSIFISTYNDTYALYAYNQSGSGGDNSTWSEIYANQLYISSGNLSELFSTYNATYDALRIWGYNQSSIVFTQILNQNASWISTYNSTYAPWSYNTTLASGWTKLGTNVILATQSDKVGINIATPSTTLHIVGNLTVSENLTLSNLLFVNKTNIGIGTSNAKDTLTIVGRVNVTGDIYQYNAITWWNGTCLNTNVSGVIVQSIGCT